jgi:hypothetical protein
MVGLGRVELPTSRLSGVRSNQLSYRPENQGVEGASGSYKTPPPPVFPEAQVCTAYQLDKTSPASILYPERLDSDRNPNLVLLERR